MCATDSAIPLGETLPQQRTRRGTHCGRELTGSDQGFTSACASALPHAVPPLEGLSVCARGTPGARSASRRTTSHARSVTVPALARAELAAAAADVARLPGSGDAVLPAVKKLDEAAAAAVPSLAMSLRGSPLRFRVSSRPSRSSPLIQARTHRGWSAAPGSLAAEACPQKCQCALLRCPVQSCRGCGGRCGLGC